MQTDVELLQQYKDRFIKLETVRHELQQAIDACLRTMPHIDIKQSRVKNPDRFIKKASKEIMGDRKYKHPLDEIQDQIGARIIVFYLSDVDPICQKILSEFQEVEDFRKDPENPSEFAYVGHHLICFIPPDIVSRNACPINFFEIQIHTLFQHAWAEASHDLSYKGQEELTFEEKRKIAWASAQSWGADVIFDELLNKGKREG